MQADVWLLFLFWWLGRHVVANHQPQPMSGCEPGKALHVSSDQAAWVASHRSNVVFPRRLLRRSASHSATSQT
jgi:hypothetical protein